MSKGLGRIERAIQALFDNEPDNAFTIDELVIRIYPGINHIERKHCVVVRRAVHRFKERLSPINSCRSWAQGGPIIVYNSTSLTSYATARVMTQGYKYTSKETLRAEFAEGGRFHEHIIEGGIWWERNQWDIEELEAKRTNDTARLERLEARIKAYNELRDKALHEIFGKSAGT
jgi:hypothetical protein